MDEQIYDMVILLIKLENSKLSTKYVQNNKKFSGDMYVYIYINIIEMPLF
jgi:hypothetical protein